jgi:Cu+-exporting ATPase
MISGEPVPVEKAEGAEVVGGTVNQNGALAFRATKVGADTLLAQIIRMVEQAQGSKLPIQALVDKITMWFVPAVMAAALLTFVVWLIWGPIRAELCAGQCRGRAHHCLPLRHGAGHADFHHGGHRPRRANGVLLRKGEALQQLKDARVVAVDKTGTLTVAAPS